MGQTNSEVWKKPEMITDGHTRHWVTKPLTDFPEHKSKSNDEIDEDRGHFAEEAKKLYRVPDDLRQNWTWVCRIYSRAPTYDGAMKGKPLKVRWTTATAWFVAAAHKPGENAQWLMTAAHNVLSPAHEYDDDGVMTGDLPALAPADAIFVDVGFGNQKFRLWIDKVSVMNGYFADVKNINVDGAILHIKDSPIPHTFCQRAPPIVSLSPFTAEIEVPFLMAGFPGEINEYPELEGFYITGLHTPPGGPVEKIANFKTVKIRPGNPPGEDKSRIVMKFNNVPSPEGFSGGPVMIKTAHDPEKWIIVAVLQTIDIGALEVGEKDLGVDLVSLLAAIGGAITKS